MNKTKADEDNRIIQLIGLELMFGNPQKWDNSNGITAIELSRKHNIKMDNVKKSLKLLQEKSIVRSIGVSPKFWKFNEYNFQRMEEDDPVYLLLCNFENIDFEQFFDYCEFKSNKKYR